MDGEDLYLYLGSESYVLDREATARLRASLGEAGREALEAFRGMNNFENHSLTTLEGALARGWDDAGGAGEARMVDAIWNGLSRLERL